MMENSTLFLSILLDTHALTFKRSHAHARAHSPSSASIYGLHSLYTFPFAIKVAADLSIGAPTLDLIVRGLTQPLDFDLRNDADKPLFRKNIASMKELHRGIEVS